MSRGLGDVYKRQELDVIVNQPVSLVVDDPKAERELKKGGSKATVSGIMWPLTWVFSIGVPFSVKTSLPWNSSTSDPLLSCAPVLLLTSWTEMGGGGGQAWNGCHPKSTPPRFSFV